MGNQQVYVLNVFIILGLMCAINATPLKKSQRLKSVASPQPDWKISPPLIISDGNIQYGGLNLFTDYQQQSSTPILQQIPPRFDTLYLQQSPQNIPLILTIGPKSYPPHIPVTNSQSNHQEYPQQVPEYKPQILPQQNPAANIPAGGQSQGLTPLQKSHLITDYVSQHTDEHQFRFKETNPTTQPESLFTSNGQEKSHLITDYDLQFRFKEINPPTQQQGDSEPHYAVLRQQNIPEGLIIPNGQKLQHLTPLQRSHLITN